MLHCLPQVYYDGVVDRVRDSGSVPAEQMVSAVGKPAAPHTHDRERGRGRERPCAFNRRTNTPPSHYSSQPPTGRHL